MLGRTADVCLCIFADKMKLKEVVFCVGRCERPMPGKIGILQMPDTNFMLFLSGHIVHHFILLLYSSCGIIPNQQLDDVPKEQRRNIFPLREVYLAGQMTTHSEGIAIGIME